MSELVRKINENFLPLYKLNRHFPESCYFNSYHDFLGIVAEALVYQNLLNLGVEFIDLKLCHNDKYTFLKRNFGNSILENKVPICEIDFCFLYQDQNYLVEVKSNKLNGFIGNISKKQELVKEVLSVDEINTILAIPIWRKSFFPFQEVSKKNIEILDLKYNPKYFQQFALV